MILNSQNQNWKYNPLSLCSQWFRDFRRVSNSQLMIKKWLYFFKVSRFWKVLNWFDFEGLYLTPSVIIYPRQTSDIFKNKFLHFARILFKECSSNVGNTKCPPCLYKFFRVVKKIENFDNQFVKAMKQFNQKTLKT